MARTQFQEVQFEHTICPMARRLMNDMGLKPIGKLGQGGQASVVKCVVQRNSTTLAKEGSVVAVKYATGNFTFFYLHLEAQTLYRLRQTHPDTDYYALDYGYRRAACGLATEVLALPFYPGRTLDQYLWGQKQPMALDKALTALVQLMEQTKELQDLKIAHNDIKFNNIIMSDQGTPRLVDYALSTNFCDQVRGGTDGYKGPEHTPLFSHNPPTAPISSQTDTYALGIVFLGLLGKITWIDAGLYHIDPIQYDTHVRTFITEAQDYRRSRLQENYYDPICIAAWELLWEMLQPDHTTRMGVSEALEQAKSILDRQLQRLAEESSEAGPTCGQLQDKAMFEQSIVEYVRQAGGPRIVFGSGGEQHSFAPMAASNSHARHHLKQERQSLMQTQGAAGCIDSRLERQQLPCQKVNDSAQRAAEQLGCVVVEEERVERQGRDVLRGGVSSGDRQTNNVFVKKFVAALPPGGSPKKVCGKRKKLETLSLAEHGRCKPIVVKLQRVDMRADVQGSGSATSEGCLTNVAFSTRFQPHEQPRGRMAYKGSQSTNTSVASTTHVAERMQEQVEVNGGVGNQESGHSTYSTMAVIEEGDGQPVGKKARKSGPADRAISGAVAFAFVSAFYPDLAKPPWWNKQLQQLRNIVNVSDSVLLWLGE